MNAIKRNGILRVETDKGVFDVSMFRPMVYDGVANLLIGNTRDGYPVAVGTCYGVSISKDGYGNDMFLYVDGFNEEAARILMKDENNPAFARRDYQPDATAE